MILDIFPSGPLETNAILFACETTRRAGIIDPSAGSTHHLIKAINQHDLQLQGIYLTHSHWDHIADLHELKQKTLAPVFVHALDAPNVVRPGADGLTLFFPIKGVEPDGYLEDEQSIEMGTLQIQVLHTPGHSPGCVCFYLREHNILFSGDTLFCGCMGRTDLPTGDESKMGSSLRKLAKLPPETRVIPGHGNQTTIAKESWIKFK